MNAADQEHTPPVFTANTAPHTILVLQSRTNSLSKFDSQLPPTPHPTSVYSVYTRYISLVSTYILARMC